MPAVWMLLGIHFFSTAAADSATVASNTTEGTARHVPCVAGYSATSFRLNSPGCTLDTETQIGYAVVPD